MPPGSQLPRRAGFSLLRQRELSAFVVLGLYRSNHPDVRLGFWTAVCMGFGFDASVEKLLFPKSTNKKIP